MSQTMPDGVNAGAERPACRPVPGGWTVRRAGVADLPGLHSWLPAEAGRELPPAEAADGELWLVAERLADPPEASGDGPAEVLAAVRLRRAIGLDQPRHWFHLGCVVHAAPQLQLFQQRHTLLLGNDHTGASELADLACDSANLTPIGQAAALRLILRAALLIVAGRRASYATRLIAELPGPRDAQGRSPFWLGLGRHFYAGDPAQAAQRFGPAWRSHVAPLLPRQPVYTAFLPDAAQTAIAQVGTGARLRADVLADEGLTWVRHVCIDDAGPVLEAHMTQLSAVMAARRLRLAAPRPRPDPEAVLPADGRAQRWLVLHEQEAGPCVQLLQATLRGGELQPVGSAAAAEHQAPPPAEGCWALVLD